MKNLVAKLIKAFKIGDENVKIVADKKQEVLIRLGKEQFQKLVDKGLSIPIMTL